MACPSAFWPGEAEPGGRYEWDIGTAGSATMLALAVLPVMAVRGRGAAPYLGHLAGFAPGGPPGRGTDGRRSHSRPAECWRHRGHRHCRGTRPGGCPARCRVRPFRRVHRRRPRRIAGFCSRSHGISLHHPAVTRQLVPRTGTRAWRLGAPCVCVDRAGAGGDARWRPENEAGFEEPLNPVGRVAREADSCTAFAACLRRGWGVVPGPWLQPVAFPEEGRAGAEQPSPRPGARQEDRLAGVPMPAPLQRPPPVAAVRAVGRGRGPGS